MTHQYPDPEDASIFARYPSTGFGLVNPPSDHEIGLAQSARHCAVGSRTDEYFVRDSPVLSSSNDFESEAEGTSEDTGKDSDGEYRIHDDALSSDESFAPQAKALSSSRKPNRNSQSTSDLVETNTARVSVHRTRGRPRSGLGRGGKGIKRGPRNPVEPTLEFKALHSEATMAFIANDFEKAEHLTLQALQINPEMYAAHSLLSEIHAARGDADKALTAAWNGAHTRPRDVQMWFRIARLILERDDSHKDSTLGDAVYCYSRIISIDKANLEARVQRAALNQELGLVRKAASDYEKILKLIPLDTAILRLLAAAYLELGEPEKALQHYQGAITQMQATETGSTPKLGWSDVNIVAELHDLQGSCDLGLSHVKSLSRWLLGRAGDSFWDKVNDDDREWDAEDAPRRIEIAEFVPNKFDPSTYGRGVPLEIRVKLGVFRLRANPANVEEAIRHFDWLEPEDDQVGTESLEFADLFREAAKSLFDAGLHSEALRFYEPLQNFSEQFDESCQQEIISCYAALGMVDEVERISKAVTTQQTVVEANNERVEEEMSTSSEDDMTHGQSQAVNEEPGRESQMNKGFLSRSIPTFSMKEGSQRLRTREPLGRQAKRSQLAKTLPDSHDLLEMYARRQNLAEFWRQGGTAKSKESWMVMSKRMVEYFKTKRISSSNDRHLRHSGLSKNSDPSEKERMHCTATTTLTGDESDDEAHANALSDDLGGITVTKWLDIFLEYAIELAREGQYEEAYRVVTSAKEADAFSCSPASMFLIHVCWFTCALLRNDDESLCNIARWFMREHQFVSDGYRLFSALNKLCESEHNWFNSGPSQKFLLRQVKAVDLSLVSDACRRRSFHEQASYATKDANGKPITAEELDVALVMLYGFILYAGKSYAYAVNYFLRALAIDPTNPTIKLSLALGYIHQALKRQAENRHQILVQGLALLLEYHESRQELGQLKEKQESCYNVGRTFHLLGLTHLAIPYYDRCLSLSQEISIAEEIGWTEDFATDAALALQGIWATAGNTVKTREVTERWLQL